MSTSAGATLDLERLIGLRAAAAASHLKLRRAGGKSGSVAGRMPGHGSDIRELRPYVQGDDFRFVDAAASARSGKHQVRTFHEDQDRTVTLLADFRTPMLWGTRRRFRSVAAGEVLAFAGWQAIAEGAKVGLLAVTDRRTHQLAPQARDSAMMRIAGIMARAHVEAWDEAAVPPSGQAFLDDVLEKAARLTKKGSAVYLATALDAPGDNFASIAEILAQRVRLSILLVQDGLESSRNLGALALHAR